MVGPKSLGGPAEGPGPGRDNEASSFGAEGDAVVFRREDKRILIAGTGLGTEVSNLTADFRSLKGCGADGSVRIIPGS